jgi:pSer/pThr/pTyr-binding forkhead associated (FHA) protein
MKIAPEDVQEYRFTVVRGAKPGSRVSFEGGVRNVRIGRAVDNDVVVSDPTVSRSHARVELRADGWFIADAGSSAGVEKMGFRVGSAPEPLESGDEFKVGDTILKFEVVAKKGAIKKAASEATTEEAAAVSQPGILARVGLQSRRAQILVAAGLAVLGMLLLWPSKPGLPPQSREPVGIEYAATIGWVPGVDESHLAGATLDVPIEGEGLSLYFQAASKEGIEIRAVERVLATIPASSSWQSYSLVLMPRSFSRESKVRLEFRNLGYDPAQGDIDPQQARFWGIRRTMLARIPSSPSSPGQLAEDLLGTRGLAERINDNVGFRATIVQSLRRALVGVMKLSGKSAVLVSIPSKIPPYPLAERIEAARGNLSGDRLDAALGDLTATLGKADAELAREYQQLVNKLTLARKREAGNEEGVILATIMRTIPDLTDPRRRVFWGDVKKLPRGKLRAYNETFDRLGAGVSG